MGIDTADAEDEPFQRVHEVGTRPIAPEYFGYVPSQREGQQDGEQEGDDDTGYFCVHFVLWFRLKFFGFEQHIHEVKEYSHGCDKEQVHHDVSCFLMILEGYTD